MDQHGVGIVGCGGMGRMHSGACAVVEGVQVVALFDAAGEKAESLAEENGAAVEGSLDSLLARDDVDVVFVTTPTPTHPETALKVIEAGKHLFLEKPLALTVEEGHRIVEAAAGADIMAAVGHVVRYTPTYEVLRDAYLDGRWGKMLNVRFERVCNVPVWGPTSWFADEKLSGGAILDLHLHDTDFILYMLGMPKSVTTYGTRNQTGWFDVTTHYGYPGISVSAQGGWYPVEKYDFNASFFAAFEEGILEQDGTREGQLLFHPQKGEPFAPETKPLPEGKVEGINITSLGPYGIEIQAFFEALRAGEWDTRASLERAYESLRVVMLELESATEGRMVDVKL